MKTSRERLFALITVIAVVFALGICPIAGAQETATEIYIENSVDENISDANNDEDVPIVLAAAPEETETEDILTVEAYTDDAVSENGAVLTVDTSESIDADSEEAVSEEVYTGNKIGQFLDKAFASFDYAIFTFFGNLHNNVLTVIFSFYTHLGDTEFAIPMLLLGCILCLFKKTRKVGMTLFLAVIIGTLFTNVCLKNICGRVRPYVTLSGNGEFMNWYNEAGAHIESDNSFPSGHTTCAFEIATALFLTVKNKKIKWIFPVYAILIGCSRLYLMVHYPTDVLAGVCVGICAGIIAFFISKTLMKTNFISNFEIKEFISKFKKKA